MSTICKRVSNDVQPIRDMRGALVAVMAAVVAIFMAPASLRTEAQTISLAKPQVVGFPPPATDVDQKVAEARARTFGLQHVPRIAFHQTFWNGTVLSMRKEREASLKLLWQARGKDADEKQRRATTSALVMAWDGGGLRLFLESKTDVPAQDGQPAWQYAQGRFWDGNDGWLGEVSTQSRNVYRYPSLNKLMEDYQEDFYFPQVSAAGGRIPWGGPTILIEKHFENDPKLTRYEKSGNETIDGAECEIFDGPGRSEKLWIEKKSGLVKAMARYYVHDEVPNYYTELIREVAGRTFANVAEYRAWQKTQSAEMQDRLSAHWAAAHWRLTEPGNLSVFSDFREIVLGVRWPMHCERIIVQPRGQASNGFEYTRAEVHVTGVEHEFSISELAKDALPREGDHLVDRRFDPEVAYRWSETVDEDRIQADAKAKLQEKLDKEAEERRINETPINSVADAIGILTDGPKVDPCKVWARAIKYLVDDKAEAFEPVVRQLDKETRDHAISKLAFTLRAMGDKRAVPVLIRALPKTLLPGRSDYGLNLEDPVLGPFMQQNDTEGKVRGGDMFDYGRAFREVASALERLSGKNFGEMELNWVQLGDAESQRRLQRAQFHRFASRWADWWEANWKSMVDDAAYSKVNLPPLEVRIATVRRDRPPVGANLRLEGSYTGWVVQSAQESKVRCFVDLDTLREGGWPKSLPAVEKIGVDSPEVAAWARQEGFDIVCITYTPPGETKPLYCLMPLGMRVWKITPEEFRDLSKAMAGKSPYPLSRPVELMVPQREVKPPYGPYSGDSFLYVTREGTAGVIRMTAQVTDPDNGGDAYSVGREFSPSGFYRGVKICLSTIVEP